LISEVYLFQGRKYIPTYTISPIPRKYAIKMAKILLMANRSTNNLTG
jgi:hypothetical protein